jgi:hypothetical protein
MDKLKFILTSKKVDFTININIPREIGVKKIRQLIDEEIRNTNDDSSYRIIGSMNEMEEDENLILTIERQNGNNRFDVLKADLKISTSPTFELNGYIENKCKIYGQVGVLIFFICLAVSVSPKVGSDNYYLFFIYPIVIIWLAADIYLRPTRALNFLISRIIQFENK